MTSKISHPKISHHGESIHNYGDHRHYCQAHSSRYCQFNSPCYCWQSVCSASAPVVTRATHTKNKHAKHFHHDASCGLGMPLCKVLPPPQCGPTGRFTILRWLPLLWMTTVAQACNVYSPPTTTSSWHHHQQSPLNCQNSTTSSHPHETHPRRAPPWLPPWLGLSPWYQPANSFTPRTMGHGPTGSLDESLKGSSEKFSQDREAFGSCPTEKFSLTDSCFLPSEDTTSNERRSRKEGSKIEVTYRQSRRKRKALLKNLAKLSLFPPLIPGPGKKTPK